MQYKYLVRENTNNIKWFWDENLKVYVSGTQYQLEPITFTPQLNWTRASRSFSLNWLKVWSPRQNKEGSIILRHCFVHTNLKFILFRRIFIEEITICLPRARNQVSANILAWNRVLTFWSLLQFWKKKILWKLELAKLDFVKHDVIICRKVAMMEFSIFLHEFYCEFP